MFPRQFVGQHSRIRHLIILRTIILPNYIKVFILGPVVIVCCDRQNVFLIRQNFTSDEVVVGNTEIVILFM